MTSQTKMLSTKFQSVTFGRPIRWLIFADDNTLRRQHRDIVHVLYMQGMQITHYIESSDSSHIHMKIFCVDGKTMANNSM